MGRTGGTGLVPDASPVSDQGRKFDLQLAAEPLRCRRAQAEFENLTSITHAFAWMLRLLLYDIFTLLPFDDENLVIPSTRVGGSL